MNLRQDPSELTRYSHDEPRCRRRLWRTLSWSSPCAARSRLGTRARTLRNSFAASLTWEELTRSLRAVSLEKVQYFQQCNSWISRTEKVETLSTCPEANFLLQFNRTRPNQFFCNLLLLQNFSLKSTTVITMNLSDFGTISQILPLIIKAPRQ